MKTFVIAEAAGCHDGSLEKALQLIEWAAEIGATACKFQWLSSPERLAERRRAQEYVEAYRLLAFPREWFAVLSERCQALGIEFMCTTYLPEDIHVVAPFVRRFKVASFEAADRHFVGLHGTWPDRDLFISAGLGADVRASVQHWARVCGEQAVGRLTVFHCVSAYPCPTEQLNLAKLQPDWYQSRLEQPYRGFSDHSRHPWAGAIAVAAGASTVEFHMRLDDTALANADYDVARTPHEAREYVEHIREAETMLGTGTSGIMAAEQPWARYAVQP